MNHISLYKQISKLKGTISCISNSFTDNKFYIGTLDGNLLYYDLRINDIIKEYKYNENENIPILDINLYQPMKNVEYDIESFNTNMNENNNYLVLLTANDEHEITFWNYRNNIFNCDLLLTVNMIDNNDDQFKSLSIDIPSLNKKYNKYIMNHTENLEYKYNIDYLYKLSHIYSSSNITKKTLLSTIEQDFNYYLDIDPSKISNFYENFSTAQALSLPLCAKISFNDFLNTPYIISGGNDMTIRYWDFTKEKLNTNITDISLENKKCYIINAHNNISYCNFSKSNFNGTEILQSNEKYYAGKKEKNIYGLSEYQYFNGIAFHSLAQKEFDDSYEDLKFCTKLADASHKSLISDLLTFNINEGLNFLISSSWDGTIKIWK